MSKLGKGLDVAAAAKLWSALARVDGVSSPPDTVAGAAKEALAARIASAIDGLDHP